MTRADRRAERAAEREHCLVRCGQRGMKYPRRACGPPSRIRVLPRRTVSSTCVTVSGDAVALSLDEAEGVFFSDDGGFLGGSFLPMTGSQSEGGELASPPAL